jgi:hypothetical protein
VEINITHILTGEDLSDYSCSQAEKGAYAGQGSWQASTNEAMRLLPASAVITNPYNPGQPATEDEFDNACAEYIKPFGAWDDEEIEAMGVTGRRALILQMIAGDAREAGIEDPENLTDAEWAEYEARATDGQCSASIFRYKPDNASGESDPWVYVFQMMH